MKYKNISYSVEKMIKDHNRSDGKSNKLNFDFTIQRPDGQWNKVAQSLLIHSILQGLLIPEIFIVKPEIDSFQPMTVLDGKQRLSTVYDFIKGKFNLSKNTPPVEVVRVVEDENGNYIKAENGNYKTTTDIVNIGNQRFDKLPTDLQEKLLDFEFSVRLITEATTKELEDQMFRLNNGKSQTSTQKAIIAFGMDLAAEITKVAHNNFIFDRLSFTAAQRKNSEDLKIAINTFIVLNDYNYTKLSNASDMISIANIIKEEKCGVGQMSYCLELFEALNNLLPPVPSENDENAMEISEEVFRSAQIPVLICNVDKYMQLLEDELITEQQYKDFLEYWVTKGFFNDEYQQYCNKSINNKSHVDARIDYMERELLNFINYSYDTKDFVKAV